MEAADPTQRALELLALCERSAAELLAGLGSLGLLSGPSQEGARHLVRRKALDLFVFVALSVLLEKRPGHGPGDRQTAEALKTAFAAQILETKRQARGMIAQTLKGAEAERLLAGIEAAAAEDPFAPYYDSFAKALGDPEQGPFGIFARSLAERHFEGARAKLAYERLFDLAASLSDRLTEGL